MSVFWPASAQQPRKHPPIGHDRPRSGNKNHHLGYHWEITSVSIQPSIWDRFDTGTRPSRLIDGMNLTRMVDDISSIMMWASSPWPVICSPEFLGLKANKIVEHCADHAALP